VHRAAGVSHRGRHAKLGEHVRGRLHLGRPADGVPPGPEGVHGGLRAVHAQHQIRAAGGLRLAAGAGDAQASGHRRIVAAHAGAGGYQVACDQRTGLPQAEHRNDQRALVRVHHARGGSARTPAPSGGTG